jgi:hypothetical protein
MSDDVIYHPLPEEAFDEKYGHGAYAAAWAAARDAEQIAEKRANREARERLKMIVIAFLVGLGVGVLVGIQWIAGYYPLSADCPGKTQPTSTS